MNPKPNHFRCGALAATLSLGQCAANRLNVARVGGFSRDRRPKKKPVEADLMEMALGVKCCAGCEAWMAAEAEPGKYMVTAGQLLAGARPPEVPGTHKAERAGAVAAMEPQRPEPAHPPGLPWKINAPTGARFAKSKYIARDMALAWGLAPEAVECVGKSRGHSPFAPAASPRGGGYSPEKTRLRQEVERLMGDGGLWHRQQLAAQARGRLAQISSILNGLKHQGRAMNTAKGEWRLLDAPPAVGTALGTALDDHERRELAGGTSAPILALEMLETLVDRPGMTPAELAAELRVAPATVERVLRELAPEERQEGAA